MNAHQIRIRVSIATPRTWPLLGPYLALTWTSHPDSARMFAKSNMIAPAVGGNHVCKTLYPMDALVGGCGDLRDACRGAEKIRRRRQRYRNQNWQYHAV